ncbi:MAG TPA: Holliday junction branch migration protein RuvA [Candidatus Scatomonas merdavium]|nr:Holliday junction branch migration protein RuvA [Candidatus Scatomonas merdavium]
MIGYIKGVIEEIEENSILLDHGGMGFRINMPAALLDRNAHKGDQVKIYTHLQVKEDDMQLYGFYTRDDLEVFRLLLNVSGIGPKGAMNILSVISADNLRFAVLSDDAAAIAKAPGIGKKTAQKLILELKDKFRLEDAFEKKLAHGQEDVLAENTDRGAAAEAIQALTALGYSAAEAMQAVKKVEGAEQMDTEALLKAALKFIF